MENDLLSDYLQGLYGIEPLDTEEEHRLAKLIQQGDDVALDKLVTHNLRFVVHVVTKLSAWNHGKMPKEDILAIGNECLLQAGRQWVPTNNAKFATYAKNFIQRGVTRELDNTSDIIRLPINIKEQIKKLSYTERSMYQILGRKPKVSELSQITKFSEGKVNQLRGYISREPVSLDSLNQDQYTDETMED